MKITSVQPGHPAYTGGLNLRRDHPVREASAEANATRAEEDLTNTPAHRREEEDHLTGTGAEAMTPEEILRTLAGCF